MNIQNNIVETYLTYGQKIGISQPQITGLIDHYNLTNRHTHTVRRKVL